MRLGMQLPCKITKLEVMGSKAWQLLQKVFGVVRSDNGRQLNGCSVLKPHSDSHQVKSLKFENEDKSESHSIISLAVKNPRDVSVRTIVRASEGESRVTSLRKTPTVDDAGHYADTQVLNKRDIVDCINGILWHAKDRVSPPVSEHSVSAEKDNLRLTSYSILDFSSTACPFMLIKDANSKGSHAGWTIILPVSWARTFWIPHISNGAHAIGLRGKHWIAGWTAAAVKMKNNKSLCWRGFHHYHP